VLDSRSLKYSVVTLPPTITVKRVDDFYLHVLVSFVSLKKVAVYSV